MPPDLANHEVAKVKTAKEGRFRGTLLVAVALVLKAAAAAQTSQNLRQTPAAPRHGILISIANRKLAVLRDGVIVRTFPISVGARISPSPTGQFEIVTRITNPTYYHPGIVIPAGNDNPIGTRWIGLNKAGYGIHGTNEPHSIGHAASHGCIRLRNRDVEQLFAMVRVGDVVEIRADSIPQDAATYSEAQATRTLQTLSLSALAQPAGGQ